MDVIEIENLIRENERRRKAQLAAENDYDPLSGRGCFEMKGHERVAIKNVDFDGVGVTPRVPRAMVEEAGGASLRAAMTSEPEWVMLRCRHDFEYWAYRCVTIHEKGSGKEIPLRLNRSQRRVVAILEKQRLANRPMRIIVLKARQWGCSTVVQMYLAWLQTCLVRGRNSLICAHVKDTSLMIRSIYSRMLRRYPEQYWQGDDKPDFKPFERTLNIREIVGRDCLVTIASNENRDSVRGGDYAFAHLSEVAFWKASANNTPEDAVRAVCGSISPMPGTLVAMESTANGVGNFFHREWLRSEAGDSDKEALFVPWHEIAHYAYNDRVFDVDSAKTLLESMDDYEWSLWNEYGCTLQQIDWYHSTRKQYSTHTQMQAEYPTNSVEAFTSADANVFNPADVDQMHREGVENAPAILRGDLTADARLGEGALRNVRWVDAADGNTTVWRMPAAGRKYVVAVDVGGRSDKSDWSVIAVVDMDGGDGRPEVVAQWRGHIDHDLLAWKAAQMARFWNNALLIFESNTFETDNISGGDPAAYILNVIGDHYRNLYRRPGGAVGFHTNRSTKSEIIGNLIMMVREKGYVEHDRRALNELLTYCVNSSGGYAASDGNHDDILMTRAIALHVINSQPRLSPAIAESIKRYAERFR